MKQHDPAEALALQKYGVGQPVARTEDPVLLRGEGRYTDDLNEPGQAYAYIVRSQHAHGILRAIRNAFPGCRTTLNCIRWYRCAFKGGYLWRA